jgi:hypothetical protein
MDFIGITTEMIRVNKRLEQSSGALYKLATAKAEAERDYRKSLAQEILILRSNGLPVTLITDVAKGNLSDLLFKRDATEAQFMSAREAISTLQTQASLLQSILKYHVDL